MSDRLPSPAPTSPDQAPTRIEATQTVPSPAAAIFTVLCDPQGHVAIDATGMLQDADGEPAAAAGATDSTRSTTRRPR